MLAYASGMSRVAMPLIDSIMSKVESPAFAAGEFGTTPTTPTYPDFFDRIRPTSARFRSLFFWYSRY